MAACWLVGGSEEEGRGVRGEAGGDTRPESAKTWMVNAVGKTNVFYHTAVMEPL